jgi:hypothetical protein
MRSSETHWQLPSIRYQLPADCVASGEMGCNLLDGQPVGVDVFALSQGKVGQVGGQPNAGWSGSLQIVIVCIFPQPKSAVWLEPAVRSSAQMSNFSRGLRVRCSNGP